MTKKTKQTKEIHRIPYDTWAHSQLSVARHYGGIEINGKKYEFDREVVKEMHEDEKKGVSRDKLYKPDLVCYQ